jgi:predicted double-glycine peptidase
VSADRGPGIGKSPTIRLPAKGFSPDSIYACVLIGVFLVVNPWLETLCVILIALGGIWLGKKASRLPGPLWAYALGLPICLLGLLIVASSTSLLDLTRPLFFITAGRTKYVILSFAITFGLATPLSRLPYKVERVAVWVLMLLFVTGFSVLPFLVPALVSDNLAGIETRIDANGICYQSTSYTCGPAAAVTALRKLGFPAQEGEIAVLARTNPLTGTLLWTLYSALKQRYADQGLQCHFRTFDSIAQLRNAGITLVSIREATLLDHCVAVLDVSDTLVTIADPATGIEVLSHGQFERKWHFSGIVVSRSASSSL